MIKRLNRRRRPKAGGFSNVCVVTFSEEYVIVTRLCSGGVEKLIFGSESPSPFCCYRRSDEKSESLSPF